MIDPVVPRFTALLKEEAIPVHVKDASTGVIQKPKHPKVRTLLSFSKYMYYNIGGKNSATMSRRFYLSKVKILFSMLFNVYRMKVLE